VQDHYKLALGQLNMCRNLIDRICQDYVRLLKYGDSLYRCKQLKRAALGRMATLMKRQGPSLAYLEQVRQHMSRLPSIDPNTRTLLVCGYPNVGKSSFMNKGGWVGGWVGGYMGRGDVPEGGGWGGAVLSQGLRWDDWYGVAGGQLRGHWGVHWAALASAWQGQRPCRQLYSAAPGPQHHPSPALRSFLLILTWPPLAAPAPACPCLPACSDAC
jgi:hypothetical protein